MANKFDLKTFFVPDNSGDKTSYTTNVGGAIIPTGKTRFLTYIRVERTGLSVLDCPVTAIGIGIASWSSSAGSLTSYATLVSEVAEKLRLDIVLVTGATKAAVNDSLYNAEIKGSIEHPILSVAGGNHMILGVRLAGTTASILGQYFDE